MKLNELASLNTRWIMIPDSNQMIPHLAVFAAKNAFHIEKVAGMVDKINESRVNLYDCYQYHTLNGWDMLFVTLFDSTGPIDDVYILAPTEVTAHVLFNQLSPRSRMRENGAEGHEIHLDEVNTTVAELRVLLKHRTDPRNRP